METSSGSSEQELNSCVFSTPPNSAPPSITNRRQKSVVQRQLEFDTSMEDPRRVLFPAAAEGGGTASEVAGRRTRPVLSPLRIRSEPIPIPLPALDTPFNSPNNGLISETEYMLDPRVRARTSTANPSGEELPNPEVVLPSQTQPRGVKAFSFSPTAVAKVTSDLPELSLSPSTGEQRPSEKIQFAHYAS